MASLKYLVVVLTVSCALFTEAKKACEIDDAACTTQAAKDSHKLVIEGVPGQVDSSDPLLRELISSDQPDLKYKLKNARMLGLKDCNVELVKVNKKESEFDYNLACPKIIIDGDYEVTGQLGDLPLEGNGKAKVTCENYNFYIHGKFESAKAKTGMTHVFINDFKVNVEPKGKVLFDLQNLFNGDKEKSDAVHKFLAENLKVVDEKIRPSAINSFMAEFVGHLNGYLKIVPVEALFAQ